MSGSRVFYIRSANSELEVAIEILRQAIVIVDENVVYNRFTLERKLTHILDSLFVTSLDVERDYVKDIYSPNFETRFVESGDLDFKNIEVTSAPITVEVIEEVELGDKLPWDFFDAFEIYYDYLTHLETRDGGWNRTLEGLFDNLYLEIEDLLIGDTPDLTISKIEYCPFSDGQCFKVHLKEEHICSAQVTLVN